MALEAESGGLELHRLPFTPTSLQQGPHLRFIREGHGLWHALFDAFYQDGTAVKTVEVDGAVFRYMEPEDEDEDAHEFLCQIYSDGHWKLAPAIHLISDEEDFGSTLNTLACWF
ncbi:hypothetical protein [Paludibacterium denitrificans]|uniref:Uncharacterized protein n=1 Tax=Paludibacterium denitrificans TaxID=2675226 RepID=A0A844GCB2_9NEIS|nr:hypothetical protein [Paludibacterium denitrificans]MTD34186.1 hypothetical protein [Paludibacterium denitrificans]MTD34254.1 hypothetical protein [Paludibacterium denitrificans]